MNLIKLHVKAVLILGILRILFSLKERLIMLHSDHLLHKLCTEITSPFSSSDRALLNSVADKNVITMIKAEISNHKWLICRSADFCYQLL